MSYNGWQTYILGDIARYSIEKICIDEINTLNYISTENMLPNKNGIVEANSIPNSKSVPLYKKGDILISNIRPYFKKIWFANINGGASTDVLIIQNKSKDIVIDKYLYYSLFQDRFFDYVMSGAKGTKMPRGDKNAIMKYQLNIPSIEEQRKIVNIFNNIDNKIELNNETNKTLEEIAQTLFKRWFVDFEFPNEEGKPYKSSGGEMVGSDMGMVPKGWKIVNLSQLGKIVTGKTPSTKDKENYGDEFNFITPVDMNGNCYLINSQRKLSRKGYEKVSKLVIPKNSIGVTCIGSNLGEVYLNAKESFTNQQINTLILNNQKYYPYIYILLKNMKSDFLNIAGGSAVPIINKTTFAGIKIICPDEELLSVYYKKVSCFYDKIKENLINNDALIELRDSLLPKLMSGEIKVNDIEANL